jgi:hypothetical protein
MSRPLPPSPGLSLLPGGRPVLIVWVFVGIVILLLGLTVYSSKLLAAGRAFVAAQGHWAKAEKDAVLYLTRYAGDRTQGNLDAFERAMNVLDGDRRARLELRKPKPDARIVREGLIAGGVHPSEVSGLVDLNSPFTNFGPIQYVVTLWERSDLYVDELHAVARRLKDGSLDGAEATRQIHRISQGLQPLEDDFATTLGEIQPPPSRS